jgi:hypothetical protein
VRDRDVILERLQEQRAAASPADWPGIDRLINRIDSERIVARAAMEAYLADLMHGPLRDEVERRFASRVPVSVDAPEGEARR